MINRAGLNTIKGSAVPKGALPQLELTPLIDIIFIVIVFLLLTANTRLLSLPVEVPKTNDLEAPSAVDDNTINITIAFENTGWSIGTDYFSEWAGFKDVLLKRVVGSPETAITIAADKQADVQRFVKVLTLLQQEKIENTRIILDKE